MASALLLRSLPLRPPLYRSATVSAAVAVIAAAFSRRYISGLSEDLSNASAQLAPASPTKSLADIWINVPNYRQWKEKEAEMLKDIEPTVRRTKEILHSNRYLDGTKLNKEDEELVIAYHPHSIRKIRSVVD